MDRRRRRVVAFKAEEGTFSSQDRLLHASYLLRFKLIQLLEPQHPRIAKGHLEALELSRVIHAEKQDLLTRGQKLRLGRADGEPAQMGDPQNFRRPSQLRENR